MNAIPVGYARRQKYQYGTAVLGIMTFAALVFLARAIYSPAPEMYRDALSKRCVAIEYAGEYYACTDPRFEGKNMDSVPVESGLTLADLRRMSRSKKK